MMPAVPLLPTVVPPDSRHGPRAKRDTRRTLLSRRDAMTSEERALATVEITRAALAVLAPVLGSSGMLGLYAAKGSEVGTAELDAQARALGWRVAYPRVVDDQRELAFHEAEIGQLAPGRFGLREPSSDAPLVPLDALTAVIVPGLAFDERGGRMGWGHGYYDATLVAASQALRVGIAFACQIVPEVPREPHDALLHVLVTERATHVIG